MARSLHRAALRVHLPVRAVEAARGDDRVELERLDERRAHLAGDVHLQGGMVEEVGMVVVVVVVVEEVVVW